MIVVKACVRSFARKIAQFSTERVDSGLRMHLEHIPYYL